MSAQWCAKKACSRCRSHKRKCDRVLPTCSLCTRLGRVCRYETVASSYSASTAAPGRRPGTLPDAEASTPPQIKTVIIQRLSSLSPKDVISTYSRTIELWFPILPENKFCGRLPSTWDDATIDFTLLCLTIVLLGTIPESGPEGGSTTLEFMSLYRCTKSWVALLEGGGINSLEVVQARLFITLFEVAHGLYPAAYISVGAAVRAAEALVVYGQPGASLFQSKPEETEERMMTWRGILILDRYIAIENGKWPPVTKGRTFPELPLSICSAMPTITASHPYKPFSRLFEASKLLERVHTALHEPMLHHSFNLEEMKLIVKTLRSFEAVLHQEISEKSRLYAGCLIMCTVGLLLLFEDGSKAYSIDYDTSEYHAQALASLATLIETIVQMVQPFSEGQDVIDIGNLPPFITFLVYKAAAIVTESLRIGDGSKKGLRRLRTLRDFLKLLSRRWRAAERYLNLLNEDTTLRVLKAMEEQ